MTVIVRDPVDPLALFHAARRIVGDPPRWHRMDCGELQMLQVAGDEGRTAEVAVHYATTGGLWADPETSDPPGYVHADFADYGDGDRDGRLAHLANELGAWLNGHGLRWMWILAGDGVWRSGTVS
jgi:hypothetical protein